MLKDGVRVKGSLFYPLCANARMPNCRCACTSICARACLKFAFVSLRGQVRIKVQRRDTEHGCKCECARACESGWVGGFVHSRMPARACLHVMQITLRNIAKMALELPARLKKHELIAIPLLAPLQPDTPTQQFRYMRGERDRVGGGGNGGCALVTHARGGGLTGLRRANLRELTCMRALVSAVGMLWRMLCAWVCA